MYFFFFCNGMTNHGKYTLYIKHIYGECMCVCACVFFYEQCISVILWI